MIEMHGGLLIVALKHTLTRGSLVNTPPVNKPHLL